MSWLFLSHEVGHDDRAAAEIQADLEKAGYRVFRARTMSGGKRWRQEIHQQIRACDAMIVLHSQYSAHSRWCLAEWLLAEGRGKLLIPLAVDSWKLSSPLEEKHAVTCDGGIEPLLASLAKWGLPPEGGAASVESREALRVLARPGPRPAGEPEVRLVIACASHADRTSLLAHQILPALPAGKRVARWNPLELPFDVDVLWTDDLERQLRDARGVTWLRGLPAGAAFVATCAPGFDVRLRAMLSKAGDWQLVDLSVAPHAPATAWRFMDAGEVGRRGAEEIVLRGALSRDKHVDEKLLGKLQNELSDPAASGLLENLMAAMAVACPEETLDLDGYTRVGGLAKVLRASWETVPNVHRRAAVRALFKLAFLDPDGRTVGRHLPVAAFEGGAERDALDELAARDLVVIRHDDVSVIHELIFEVIPEAREIVQGGSSVLKTRGFR